MAVLICFACKARTRLVNPTIYALHFWRMRCNCENTTPEMRRELRAAVNALESAAATTSSP